MRANYVELGSFNDAQLDSFFSKTARRLAVNAFGSEELDEELADLTREAVDLVRTAIGSPLLVVPAVDYFVGIGLWRLSVPTAGPDHPEIGAGPAVAYVNSAEVETTLPSGSYDVDFSAAQTTVFLREAPEDVSGNVNYPFRVRYRGGHILTGDRLDLIRGQIRIYLSNARYQRDQGGNFQTNIRNVVLRNLQELAHV